MSASDEKPQTEYRAIIAMTCVGAKALVALCAVVVAYDYRCDIDVGGTAVENDIIHRAFVLRWESITLLVTGVAWLYWLVGALKTARERIRDTGSSLPSVGSAIGAYLIPIICLWRPRTHLLVLAAASDPEALPDTPSFRERTADYRTSPREPIARADWHSVIPIRAWWAAWLVGGVARVFADTFRRLGHPTLYLELSMVSNAALFVSLVCAGLVVRGITLRQRECVRRLVDRPLTDDEDEEEVEVAPRRQPRRSAQRRAR